MTKHPHRLMLVEGRTWKCTLEGCTYFVHLGLAHVILGRKAICWECGDAFTVIPASLKEDTPRCDTCRIGVSTASSIEDWIEERMKQKSSPVQKDEIEVIEPAYEDHIPDCDIWSGKDCSCGKYK